MTDVTRAPRPPRPTPTGPVPVPRPDTPHGTPRPVAPRSGALRRAAARIDAATPGDRDRAVDALRAFAILGVVLGHWLVTALVADGGSLHAASPLRDMPRLAPVSWAFQTLAVFRARSCLLYTRGSASARARGECYG
ncbi:acyltransferase, partial [Streptomyces olivaceus]